MLVISEPLAFEWDEGNAEKNWIRHGATQLEVEEVFFDDQKKLLPSVLHPSGEERQLLIGKTRGGRALFVVFTIRKACIRVISARDLSKKESRLYEKQN